MIPYLAVPWGQLLLLPVVVVVEAIVLRRSWGGRVAPILGQSFVANLTSTLVGAGLYRMTMGRLHEPLFDWWFKGGFGTEAIRNACISIGFASVLWLISWVIESFVLARLRKTGFSGVSRPCAVANVVTYAGLIVIALWFQI
jgi:hypothetical protein